MYGNSSRSAGVLPYGPVGPAARPQSVLYAIGTDLLFTQFQAQILMLRNIYECYLWTDTPT